MKVVKLGEIPEALFEKAELEVIPSEDGFVNVLYEKLKEAGPAGLTDCDRKHAVAVVDDYRETARIILIGISESDALLNLADAVNDAFNEGEFGLDKILEAGYPDFDEHGVLIGADFLLRTEEWGLNRGWRYTLHIDFNEGGKLGFEFRYVPPYSGISDRIYRTDKVPGDVYWKAIETLAELYFGA